MGSWPGAPSFFCRLSRSRLRWRLPRLLHACPSPHRCRPPLSCSCPSRRRTCPRTRPRAPSHALPPAGSGSSPAAAAFRPEAFAACASRSRWTGVSATVDGASPGRWRRRCPTRGAGEAAGSSPCAGWREGRLTSGSSSRGRWSQIACAHRFARTGSIPASRGGGPSSTPSGGGGERRPTTGVWGPTGDTWSTTRSAMPSATVTRPARLEGHAPR